MHRTWFSLDEPTGDDSLCVQVKQSERYLHFIGMVEIIWFQVNLEMVKIMVHMVVVVFTIDNLVGNRK